MVKRALLRGGVVLVAVLSVAALFEIGLRLWGEPWRGTERVFDARYGEVRRDSWIFDFAIDPTLHRAVDLRGQHIPLRKPAGERRILFVGDSATEGAFVPIEASFPLRMQALLDARDPDHHVRAINAGVWGMTTIDALHLLQDKLLPLQPDVVVVGLFLANDINFNLGHVERRRATRGWLDRARTHSALARQVWLATVAAQTRLGVAPEDARWLPVEASLRDERGLFMLSYPEGELALYFTHASALVDRAYDTLREVLRQFQALGSAQGFETRVLLIPTPSAVARRLRVLAHPNLLRELAERDIHVDTADLDFTLPVRRTLAICRELSLACVDPTEHLRRLGTAAFFARDEHPTAAGHDALAHALLEAP